jgi:hypothetical protein
VFSQRSGHVRWSRASEANQFEPSKNQGILGNQVHMDAA